MPNTKMKMVFTSSLDIAAELENASKTPPWVNADLFYFMWRSFRNPIFESAHRIGQACVKKTREHFVKGRR